MHVIAQLTWMNVGARSESELFRDRRTRALLRISSKTTSFNFESGASILAASAHKVRGAPIQVSNARYCSQIQDPHRAPYQRLQPEIQRYKIQDTDTIQRYRLHRHNQDNNPKKNRGEKKNTDQMFALPSIESSVGFSIPTNNPLSVICLRRDFIDMLLDDISSKACVTHQIKPPKHTT